MMTSKTAKRVLQLKDICNSLLDSLKSWKSSYVALAHGSELDFDTNTYDDSKEDYKETMFSVLKHQNQHVFSKSAYQALAKADSYVGKGDGDDTSHDDNMKYVDKAIKTLTDLKKNLSQVPDSLLYGPIDYLA